ncbi:hypothetical protein QUB63_00680 [Microcoleus sp. ARI1-B5]|uniref:hypothetical protein n=1 Tax=unclassified Microcoleus TaxID=2642155 RepID=UPI002FCF183E
MSNSGTDFAFETTLAARSFVAFLRSCKTKNYTINLIYFWLRSPELAVARVARRVASGGHSIPEDVIRRRYDRGLLNLIALYLPLCDNWIIYDNSHETPELVAEGSIEGEQIIYNIAIGNQINQR